MKKWLCLAMSAILLLTTTACGAETNSTDTTTTTSTSSTATSVQTTTEGTSAESTTITTTDGNIVMTPTDETTEAVTTTTQDTTVKKTNTTKKTTTAKTTKKTTAKTSGGSTAISTIELHVKTTYCGVEGYFCFWDCGEIGEELLTKFGIFPDKAGATVYFHYTEYYDVDNGKEVWFACYADKQVGNGNLEYFGVNVHTKQPPTTTTTTTTTTRPYENGFPEVDVEIHEFETYMLELINADRVKAGLKPLKMNTYYHDCAEIRAEEASKYFAHGRPNGKQWHTVFEDCNKTPFGHNTGENLGIGFGYSRTWIEGIYRALYDSPGHQANMMNPQFTEVAIAIYWTPMEDRPTGYSGTVAQLFFGKIE